jgi:hypothetical protein
MQDYGVVGVHSMEDRKRLFQLIQTLKSDFPNADTSKRISSLTSRSSNITHESKPSTSSSGHSSQPQSVSIPIEQPKAFNDNFQSNFAAKHSRSVADLDDDVSSSPRQFRKLAKSILSSPKSNRSNLNVYGVPNSASSQIKPKVTGDLSDRIRVCVRKRPLSKKELRKGETDITPVNSRRSLTMLEPNRSDKIYRAT